MGKADKYLDKWKSGSIPHEVPYNRVRTVLLRYFDKAQLKFRGDDLIIHDERLEEWANSPGDFIVIPVRKGRHVIKKYILDRLLPMIEYLEELEAK